MLGQPASSQTVCRPSRRTSSFIAVCSGPVRSRVLTYGGLRSVGVWLLRASSRSIRRPSGASTTPSAYVLRRDGAATSLAGTGAAAGLACQRGRAEERAVGEVAPPAGGAECAGEGAFGRREGCGHWDLASRLSGQRSDPGV